MVEETVVELLKAKRPTVADLRDALSKAFEEMVRAHEGWQKSIAYGRDLALHASELRWEIALGLGDFPDAMEGDGPVEVRGRYLEKVRAARTRAHELRIRMGCRIYEIERLAKFGAAATLERGEDGQPAMDPHEHIRVLRLLLEDIAGKAGEAKRAECDMMWGSDDDE